MTMETVALFRWPRVSQAVPACWVLAAYLAVVNVLAVLVVRHDKRVARRRARRRGRHAGDRIPERGFLALAVMGGGIGGLAAFGFFRHKTRKARFMVPFVMATLLGATLAGAWAVLLGCAPQVL